MGSEPANRHRVPRHFLPEPSNIRLKLKAGLADSFPRFLDAALGNALL
jgi:hypothetical protein